MPSIASSEVLRPKDLDPNARAALVDALYAVHCEVFDGVDRKAFAKYVVDSPAEDTEVVVHRNAEGAIVGYCALHAFERRLGGQLVTVLRTEAGTLRAYRGQSKNPRFGAAFGLRHLLSKPGRPTYILSAAVHPSSYLQLTRFADRVFPNHLEPTPPDVLAFMGELARDFGLDAVDPRNPLVREVGWKTRETAAEREYWRRCEHRAARFYVEQNPGFVHGHGLLTLVPTSIPGAVRFIARIADTKLQSGADAALRSARDLPAIAPVVRRLEIRRQLRASARFGALGDACVDALARDARLVSLRAGERLATAGEEACVLVRGSLHVLDGREETVIDQLGAGAVIEGARAGTARAAVPSSVLCIDRAALQQIARADAALRGALDEARRICGPSAGNAAFAREYASPAPGA